MKVSKKLLLINSGSLALLVITLLEVFYNGFLFNLDLSVNSFISKINSNYFLLIFSKSIGFIFDITIMIVISLIISAFLWIKFSKKESVFFIFTMLLSGAATFLIKELIMRARPINALIFESNSSFPSGHATTAIVFFGLLIYLTLKNSKSRSLKLTTIIISILLILIICLTRLYLNVHWLSDVLGGLLLGAFILTGTIMIMKPSKKKT